MPFSIELSRACSRSPTPCSSSRSCLISARSRGSMLSLSANQQAPRGFVLHGVVDLATAVGALAAHLATAVGPHAVEPRLELLGVLPDAARRKLVAVEALAPPDDGQREGDVFDERVRSISSRASPRRQ